MSAEAVGPATIAVAEMVREECLRLLSTVAFGRVIHTDRALPACTPVNFRTVGHTVVFRTSAGSPLAMATNDAIVAFEVDRIDEQTRTGWSVVVTGVANAVRDVSELVRLDQLGLVSWAGADRAHWVRISIADITGHRIGA